MHLALGEHGHQPLIGRTPPGEVVCGERGVAVAGQPAGADHVTGLDVMMAGPGDHRPAEQAGDEGERGQARPAFQQRGEDPADPPVAGEGQAENEAREHEEHRDGSAAIQQAEDELQE